MTTASDVAYSIRPGIEGALKTAAELNRSLEVIFEAAVEHDNLGTSDGDEHIDAGDAWELASTLDRDLATAVDLAAALPTISNLNELATCLNRVHDNALLLADKCSGGSFYDSSGVDHRAFVDTTDNLVRRVTTAQVAHAETDAAPAQSADSSPRKVETSWLAQRISQFAARLLSPEHRANKIEEFACELYEIASAGAPRRRQVAHAVRVLAYILPLRRALSGSRRAIGGGNQT